MSRVVFACAGNICRSPLAEHLLRRALIARRIEGIAVTSMGLVARPGEAPSPATLRAAAAAGIDLRAHRSRRFEAALLSETDHVIAMGRSQVEAIRERAGLLPSRVRLLGSFGGPGAEEVADPEDGDDAVFTACVRQIVRHVEALADGIARGLLAS